MAPNLCDHLTSPGKLIQPNLIPESELSAPNCQSFCSQFYFLVLIGHQTSSKLCYQANKILAMALIYAFEIQIIKKQNIMRTSMSCLDLYHHQIPRIVNFREIKNTRQSQVRKVLLINIDLMSDWYNQ